MPLDEYESKWAECSTVVSNREAYTRLEILSRWRTAYAPDTESVREMMIVQQGRELFIGRLILEEPNCAGPKIQAWGDDLNQQKE